MDERTKCSRGDQQQQLQAKGAVASFRHGLEVENDEKQSCTLGRASEHCFEASGLLHSQQVNSGAMRRPALKKKKSFEDAAAVTAASKRAEEMRRYLLHLGNGNRCFEFVFDD